MLWVGAYPEGQADAYSKAVTSYSSAIAQLLMQGLDTFVCLMTDDEVVRPNNVAYEVRPACVVLAVPGWQPVVTCLRCPPG